MNYKSFIQITIALIALTTPLTLLAADSTTKETNSMKDIRIKLNTDKGAIDITLFPGKAPITVASFLNLAKHKFYDGLVFHRVIPNFMIQGGDPTGTGSGSPGYKFEDEFNTGMTFDKKGLLAMANSGPRSNGSQFFITHVPTPHLNEKHTIFGAVTKGQDIVDSIEQGDKIKSIEVLDSTDALFKAQADRIEKWDEALKK